MRKLVKITIGILLAMPLPVYAAVSTKDSQPALLEADEFVYDQENDIFTASGHVELEQDGQIIQSDKMIYNHGTDVIEAHGHVVFIDKTGQVYFADKVRLEQKMKTGAIQQIGLMFSDGSRFAARQGQQVDQNTIVLRDGIYSPCNLCAEDPSKAPMWQLRANKIVHDKADQDVYYHNVKIDAYGVPVGYLPYFSHPDPDVVSRSGFLIPKFSTDSKNGFMLRNYYYHNFSPYEDATLEVSPSQKSGTVYGAQYRRNFYDGQFNFNGSLNYSDIRSGTNNTIIENDKYRGHIMADGKLLLTPTWSAGFNAQRTFDDYYLRDFDFSEADVLLSNAYIEQIKNRNYFNVNGTFFQDLRPNINQEQPDILPWVKYSAMGTPNDMLGGRWNVDNEFVTLFRDGQQSTSRLTTVPTWERRDILPLGFQTTVNTKLRTDGYWIRQDSPFNTTPNSPNLDRTAGRFFPTAQGLISYPMVRPAQNITAVVEPKVGLTLAPQSSGNSHIPNEDSRDAQIDVGNLFDDNRFPGSDQVENGSHFAYGIKLGGYENENGNSMFATIGQSHRLTDNNPFPTGSGLEENRSDFVGQLETTFYDKFYTDYRFQLNEENFQDRRHELQAYYLGDTFELRTNYVFAQVVQGTGLPTDRQQIGFSAGKALTKKWSVAADTLSDLTGDGGLLKSGFSVQYKNECIRLSARADRDLTDRLAGGSESRVLFSLGLRNLGGYDTPLLQNDPLYQPFGTSTKL